MLVHCHDRIQNSLHKSLELSMGMSDDYLQAVSPQQLITLWFYDLYIVMYCLKLILCY